MTIATTNNAPRIVDKKLVAARSTVRKLTPQQRKELAKLMVPRVCEEYFRHIPHPAQQVFLTLRTREALFGGAVGGGKSDALLMAALQYVDVPGYSALILRRTWPDLALPGAIMDRAKSWLIDTDAQIHEGGRYWTFPSGARLQFGHLGHDNDKLKYQGAEFHYVAFDELTQWPSEATYDYLFSRIRKPAIACLNCGTPLSRYKDDNGEGYVKIRYTHKQRDARRKCKNVVPDPKVLAQYPPAPDGLTVFDIPLRLRAATNPGGPGATWVKERFIDKRTKRKDAVFVPSLLKDNPSLDEETYLESLSHLNPIERERLLNGDWDILEAGDYFDRAKFVVKDKTPNNIVQRVRFWDMAATQDGGDWTVGALVSKTSDNMVYIEDIVRLQGNPARTQKTILATAMSDGIRVPIRMEQEPGSSGVTVIDNFRRNVLPGFNFDGIRSTGSKEARATALSTYADAGNVCVIMANWNRPFFDEAEVFPNGAHDDQVDSVAGAYNHLMLGKRTRLVV